MSRNDEHHPQSSLTSPLLPPTNRYYARSSSLASENVSNSNLILVDWDGTTQGTGDRKTDGKKIGILGKFNMDLIRELCAHMKNGGTVAITTAGTMPCLINDILGLNNPPFFTLEGREKYLKSNNITEEQVKEHVSDPDVMYFLKNTFCFAGIKKGYEDDHEDRVWDSGGHIWEERTEIKDVKDGKISLVKMIEMNKGIIKVYEDDIHGQTFVEQLSKLKIPHVKFELHDKSLDEHGFENIEGLPSPVNIDLDRPPSTRPLSRLSSLSRSSSIIPQPIVQDPVAAQPWWKSCLFWCRGSN